ncbi:MAG: hypothetical protein HRT87_01280 [Legionellales bacterium]|nr:hypothetical protein [Legionellales bacterium]
MILIKLSAFVDNLRNGDQTERIQNKIKNRDLTYVGAEKYHEIVHYQKLITLPPSLGKFIACDLEGNVLEKPVNYERYGEIEVNGGLKWGSDCKQYQEAQNRVIFEGCKYNDYQPSNTFNTWSVNGTEIFVETNGGYRRVHKYKTLEDLTSLNLTLNKNGIKLIKG